MSTPSAPLPRTPLTPGLTPTFRPPPLLGSLVCTPATAVAGQSVRVEARSPAGTAYDEVGSTPISINGVPGPTQWLSWERPGRYTLTAIAHRRGAVERRTTTIEVKPRPDGKQPPALQARWRPDEPTVVELTILRAPPMRRRGTPSRLPASQASPLVRLGDAPVRPAGRPGVERRPVAARPAGVRGLSGSGTEAPTYKWDFGDGTRLGTLLPSMAHDYGPRLDATHLYQSFQVAVTIREPDAKPVALRRTITVHNPYVLMKRRGVLQPFVEEADPSARFTPSSHPSRATYRGRLRVRNPEAYDLVLTSRRIERVYGDDARRFSELLAAEATRVVLKARSTTTLTVAVRAQLLPKQVIGFAAHYVGLSPHKVPVRVTAHFDLPEHLPSRFTLRPELSRAIDALAARGLLADPRRIPLRELAAFERRGLLAPGLLRAGTAAVAAPALARRGAPPPAVEGNECDPWNVPDVVPDGMFCMPTQERRKVLMPPRFMNARRGDIVLSPSDGGLISDVLAAVTPPQPFSHSGIMTRNRDEITHSTGSDERLTNEAFVGSDGIRPDVLKYVWPGVITQSVEQSVHGQAMVDPETGTTYTISGFASQLGQVGSPSVVTPMVVKPDPLTETTQLRAKLNAIATFAASQAGKSHYRFFCYTNPAIGLTESAPAEAKWAAGTFPSVCSSFIWMAIRQSGEPIEGALEPADMDGGAQIALDTKDGLYLYDADERLAAGQVLYNRLHSYVMNSVGSFGDALTDVADDISNQVLNTFATDWADEDAKDSEAWRETTDANAVSPVNLMFYDSPLYGFAEPLVFRDWRVEEVVVHRWKKVAQTGTVRGVVRHKGQPVQGAHVQLSASQFTTSGADGSFVLAGAPAGSVLLDAHKVQGDILLSAQVGAVVTGNQTTSVVVDLEAPSELFRRVRVEGWMQTIDYEFAAAGHPSASRDIEGIVDLDPGTATHKVKHFDNPCDDAVGRLILSCDLQSDGSVRVKPKLRCYHSDEPSGDYSQGELDAFVVKPGKSWSGWMYVDDDNYTEAHFTVTNRTNQS